MKPLSPAPRLDYQLFAVSLCAIGVLEYGNSSTTGTAVDVAAATVESLSSPPTESTVENRASTVVGIDGHTIRDASRSQVSDGPIPSEPSIHLRTLEGLGSEIMSCPQTSRGEPLPQLFPDADREWAYDRQSHIGRLDEALDKAASSGWTIVDMKKDWKRVFLFE